MYALAHTVYRNTALHGEKKELSDRVRVETASEKCLVPQYAALMSGQGFQIACFKIGQIMWFSLADNGEFVGALPVNDHPLPVDDYFFEETGIPSGWVLRDISCVVTSESSTPSTFDVNLAQAMVIVRYKDVNDIVVCTFTNGRPGPVGGFIEPADKLGILGPCLGLLGLIGTVTLAAVACRKKVAA